MWDRRINFGGLNLTMSVLPYLPFMTYEEGFEKPGGYSHDIVEILSKMLNFTYHFIEPEDQSYGSKEANETMFNGMVGMLQRQVFIHTKLVNVNSIHSSFQTSFAALPQDGAKQFFFSFTSYREKPL